MARSPSSSSSNEMLVFQNKQFDLPLSLLPKMKDNKHQQFTPPCAELVSVLSEFNFFKDSNLTQQHELLEMAALKVSFKTYKAGEFLTDSQQNDVHFILKGDMGLFEERNEREIKQEHYWRQQIDKIKRKQDSTTDELESAKLEEEFFKAEKVLNFYYKEDQVKLLSKDVQRHQINFNINNECMFKQTQVIKSGICVGPQTEHSERNPNLGNYQIVALNTCLILTLDEMGQSDIFRKNANIQNKLFCILSKYFENIAFEKDILQKVIKGITEISFAKNQLIYHENFDTSQNLYILTEGSVEITAKRLKQQILLDTINQDEIFGGEFLASNRSLRQYTARSQTNPTSVFAVSYDLMKQYFPANIMEEFRLYGELINDKYQNTLNSHIQHIVSICKQRGLKVPLNYQNPQNISNNTTTTTINNESTITLTKSNTQSRSPHKRSSVSRLSKKHSAIIEESLINLKRQQTSSVHGSNLSGYQSGSTNTSSLGNSGFENKISALYNSISNKAGSNTLITLKSRQNSIDIEMNEIVPPRVHFQQSIPSILNRDLSNDNYNNNYNGNTPNNCYYPKSLNVLPSLPSPKSGTLKQKISETNSQQSQNHNMTQNQLLKRYLSSRYSKHLISENQPSQNFEDEIRRVEPMFRKSQTITKEQLHSQLVNLQTQQQQPETPMKKVFEEFSPIKKMRNYSVRDSQNNQFGEQQQSLSHQCTPNSLNQRRILRQFRVSEEVDKYINQDSTSQSTSAQQSPIKRMKEEINQQKTPKHNTNLISAINNNIYHHQSHSSLDKYKGIQLHKQSKSITNGLLFPTKSPNTNSIKKQENSPFSMENQFTKSNYLSHNYFCKSLTNI